MTDLALPVGITISNDVLFQNMGDEYVLLNTQTERYFSLNYVGARFWELLSGGLNIPSAIEKLLAEYEVDRETLEKDLYALLKKLENDQLVIL